MPALALVVLVVAWGLVVAALDALALRPFHRAAGAHWTERARVLWPARLRSRGLGWGVPLFVGVALGVLDVDVGAPWWGVALALGLGGLPATYRFDRAVFPDLAPRTWVVGGTVRLLLALIPLALLGVGWWAMPERFGLRAGLVVAATGAATLLTAFAPHLAVLRLLGVLQDPPPAIDALVRDEGRRLGVDVRRVGVLRAGVANALALPLQRSIVVTDAALDALSTDELRAVIRHELGHLGEPWTVLALRVAVLPGLAPLLLAKPAIATESLLVLVALALGCLGFLVAVARVRVRMEARADDHAGDDPADRAALARALERLYELNLLPASIDGRPGTHPHLVDRLRALGVEPSWPIPPPASGGRVRRRLAIAVFLVSLVASLTVVLALRIDPVPCGGPIDVRVEPAEGLLDGAVVNRALVGADLVPFPDAALFMREGDDGNARWWATPLLDGVDGGRDGPMRGVAFLLEPAITPDPAALDDLLGTAATLAAAVGGRVVDADGQPIDAAALRSELAERVACVAADAVFD